MQRPEHITTRQALANRTIYLKYDSFSRNGLIEHLTSEYGGRFTLAQAEYAADMVGLK